MRIVNRAAALVASALAVTWLLCGAAANAQGTSGALPDPITTSELARFADRLDLSQQQELAASQFHDQYLAEYLELRDREIDRYLDLTREARQSFFRMQDREPIKESIEQKEALMQRIRQLDERLFSQMQGILSDEQQALLVRIRQARDRDRVRSGMMAMGGMFNPALNADLPLMVSELELSPEQVEAVDAVLVPYESRLTSELTSLAKSMDELTLDVYDGMVERMAAIDAQADGDGDGRERFRQRFQIMSQVWQERSADTTEKGAKLAPDARRTLAQITAALPQEEARSLHHRFYREAYPGATRGMTRVENRIERALALDALTDDERGGVGSLREQYIAGAERLLVQLADVMDEQRNEGPFARIRFGRNDREEDPLEVKEEELEDRLRDLNESTLASLENLLGEEALAALAEERDAAGGRPVVQEIEVVSSAGGVMTFRGESEGPADRRVDPFIPTPISSRDIERYATMLGFGEGEIAMIQMLHERYLEKYASLNEQYMEPLRAMREDRGDDGNGERRGGRGGGRRGGPPAFMMDPQSVAQAHALRRGAFNAIEALDQSFFDEASLLLEKSDEAAQRISSVRLDRQREVFDPGNAGDGPIMLMGGGGGARELGLGGSEEHRVDFLRVLETIEMTSETRAVLRSIVREYETSASAAFRANFDAQMSMREATESQMAEAMQVDDEDDGRGGRERRVRMNFNPEMREALEGHRRSVAAAREQLLNVNRRALEGATAALPADEAASLREAYRRSAFPDAYRDQQNAHQHIDAVLALEDLTDEQRAQLMDAAAEYRSAYAALTDRIIEQLAGSVSFDPAADGPGGWERLQEQRDAMEKIRFERGELNAKARQRLEILLSEEQFARVPGLAERGEDGDGRGGRGERWQRGRGGRGG